MADQEAQPSAVVGAPASHQKEASPAPAPAVNLHDLELLPEDGDLESESDSAYASSVPSGSTSVLSSIARGLVENGRRYQSYRDNNISFPSDDKQFEATAAIHHAFSVIESLQENPYFRSPLSQKAQHVLDVGTGDGSWPISVADHFPNLTIHGIDLYPPPQKWVPPNCIFEVDDLTNAWTWDFKWDFVHIRFLNASLPEAEWERLYKRAYHNLAPGGWIEHTEISIYYSCDDDSLPKDSLFAKHGALSKTVLAQTGFTGNVPELMRAGIEGAGFVNVHERNFKMPLGDWPKHPIYKEAGRLHMKGISEGLEGWSMYAMTRWGQPKPWTPEEVAVYCAKLRQEMNQNYHIYQQCKKVWAQKPFGAPKTE